MSSRLTVGISDLKVGRDGDVLITYALGSCVGICVYDATSKLAGLSHILLPDSTQSPKKDVMRYADSALPELIRQMEQQGGKRIFMKAKIAGGAQMFAPTGNSNISNIGERNVMAVKQALAKLRIPIMAQEVGQNYGRTLYFHSANGEVLVKSVNKGEKTI